MGAFTLYLHAERHEHAVRWSKTVGETAEDATQDNRADRVPHKLEAFEERTWIG